MWCPVCHRRCDGERSQRLHAIHDRGECATGNPACGMQGCPGNPDPGSEFEFGFENMDRGGEGPMMIGQPESEVRAAMASKAAMFPECRYALRRRTVGPWITVEDPQPLKGGE